MKQVIQPFKSGELTITDVPSPNLRKQGILVRTAASLVSAGTERMVVDFAEMNMFKRARARPDLVRQVVESVHREGLATTFELMCNQLDQQRQLGYSSPGIAAAGGEEVTLSSPLQIASEDRKAHVRLSFVPDEGGRSF